MRRPLNPHVLHPYLHAINAINAVHAPYQYFPSRCMLSTTGAVHIPYSMFDVTCSSLVDASLVLVNAVPQVGASCATETPLASPSP